MTAARRTSRWIWPEVTWGAAGAGEGALLGRSRGLGAGARGQGRAPHGTRGGAGGWARAPPAGPQERSRGPPPGTHPPSRCPLSSPCALLPASGCGGCRGTPSGTQRSPRPSGLPGPPRERLTPIPELVQPFAWRRPAGGRGCYLGCRRMSEGRATTSCPTRPPEHKPDLLGSAACVTAFLFAHRSGGPAALITR